VYVLDIPREYIGIDIKGFDKVGDYRFFGAFAYEEYPYNPAALVV